MSPTRSCRPGALPVAMTTVPVRAMRPPKIRFDFKRLAKIQISPTATIRGNIITRTVASITEVRNIALFQKTRSAARSEPLINASPMSRPGMVRANRPVQSAKGSAIANRQNAVAAGPTGLPRTRTGPIPDMSAAKAKILSGVNCMKQLLVGITPGPRRIAAVSLVALPTCKLSATDWQCGFCHDQPTITARGQSKVRVRRGC